MLQNLLNFSADIGLSLSQQQAQQLLSYAQCVWKKKDFLNLTSVSCLEEIFTRHICDGLVAAQLIEMYGGRTLQLADAGAGCGYIGLTVAVACPKAHVTLFESIERRCKFMTWASMQIGLTNVTVHNVRLGQGTPAQVDILTERAMGQLPDIIKICLSVVKPGGLFMAFQGEHPQTEQISLPGVTCLHKKCYQLPCDNTPRYLVVFRKDHV